MASQSNDKKTYNPVSGVVTATASGAAGGAIGVLVGGPAGGIVGGAVGSLIPALAGIPASKRHSDKVNQAFVEINEKLEQEIESLKNINDEQYKIICETLGSLARTVELEKIEYLKTIVISSVSYSDYFGYESIQLSRIVRDISSQEIRFLIENFKYDSINVYSWNNTEDVFENSKEKELEDLRKRTSEKNGLLLLSGSEESAVVNGLVNLGVLNPGELSIGVHVYKYSKISVKLIALLSR